MPFSLDAASIKALSGAADDAKSLAVTMRRLADRIDPPASSGGRRALAMVDVQAVIDARAHIAAYFDPSLFSDPGRDIMTDLLLADLAGKRVCVSSVCVAAKVPAKTALRWVQLLSERGLLICEAEPDDGRRYIALSAAARDAMSCYLSDVLEQLGGSTDSPSRDSITSIASCK